jgi:hypothetical protein
MWFALRRIFALHGDLSSEFRIEFVFLFYNVCYVYHVDTSLGYCTPLNWPLSSYAPLTGIPVEN